jgi:hypothetical protein
MYFVTTRGAAEEAAQKMFSLLDIAANNASSHARASHFKRPVPEVENLGPLLMDI